MFQPSVLKTYLARQDQAVLDRQYDKFQLWFGNEAIRNNILLSKESSLQGEFLAKLFGEILGYTLKPEENFNLQREFNNETDSKEADGVILVTGIVKAVIELKDAKTPNLDKIDEQAFGYHRNHSKSQYIITSNYQNLRFYIDKKTNQLQFDLFNLSREQFALLYLCLSWESIRQDLPQKILNESVTEEVDITKKLYTDYSTFKRLLFDDLCAKNPQFDKLTLFKKTQKLLDRLLFIFFAEDRDLLRANEIERIVTEWEKLKKLRIQVSLYDRFKDYFGYLNTGDTDLDIFPYNGGLFLPDEILDEVAIDNTLLAEHSRKLALYDFASEVDVNILGHIFEHSLTETEEKTAELTGQAPSKQKGKRKKDGIFYTPKYITSYIVEQTVGKLCEAKRLELGIDAIAEAAEKLKSKNAKQKKEQQKKLHEKTDEYRNWLLGLKICDPACGSGAFLNQALEFLIDEHRSIDELHTIIDHGQTKGAFTFEDVETAILENNLYGVDINDESVDIAKLSLWLRSAKKGRKLNHLSHRIKLGNSLIDDPTIAGEKAFNWQAEFPEVFDKENPGFDVVIGNPPYVSNRTMNENDKSWYKENYRSAVDQYDLYVLFMEQSEILLKNNGYFSFITPDKFLISRYGIGILNYLSKKVEIVEYWDLTNRKVFPDASVYPVIVVFHKREDIEGTASFIKADFIDCTFPEN